MLDISELGYSCLEGSVAMIWRWYTEVFIVQFVFTGKNSPKCLSFPLLFFLHDILPNFFLTLHLTSERQSLVLREWRKMPSADANVIKVSGARVLLWPLSTYSLNYCQAVQRRSGHMHTSDYKHRKALSRCANLVFEYKLRSKAKNEHSSYFLLFTGFVY